MITRCRFPGAMIYEVAALGAIINEVAALGMA